MKTAQSSKTCFYDNVFLGQPIGTKPFVDGLHTFDLLLEQKKGLGLGSLRKKSRKTKAQAL